MEKETLFQLVERQKEKMFDMACQIFDKPECEGKEYFAAELLTNALESEGFAVERGVGGLETAFRAAWSNGEGGPNIGILGEYDALVGRGHGCGHHLQTPAAIGAAVAVKELLKDSDMPFTVTVYGTPAEETFGGKIIMEQNGCFHELDVALGTHATGKTAFVGGSGMALRSFVVTFKGKSSHASGSPHEGRSAGDAMLLSFNAIEYMREHVKDGSRMHYTVKEPLGPSNVVPAKALAGYTLRSRDNAYLDELERRFRKIIKGACLMTQTDAEFEQKPSFASRKRNEALAQVAKTNLDLIGVETLPQLIRDTNGSTDFGNVSCVVPGSLVYLPYCPVPGHSQEWVDAGKTEMAEKCMMDSAKVLAGMTYDLILDPSLIDRAKAEFSADK